MVIMKNYKISVVTIAYNCESVIEETIKSVVNQTYPNIEYIIIDGASKDGTLDVVKKYENSIDYISSEPDKGIYDAMNKGIAHATGDFIVFMNAGDSFFSNNVLELVVPQIEDDSIIVYGDIMKVAKRYMYLAKPAPLSEMHCHMTVFHQATLTRLSYHKLNLFDITFRSSGDYNFFYSAAIKDKVKFQYIPVTMANFDCVDGTSNTNFKKSQRENLRIWDKEKDVLFRIKLEYKLSIIALKIWIKKNFMSEKNSDLIEMRRLRRLGFVLVEK